MAKALKNFSYLIISRPKKQWGCLLSSYTSSCYLSTTQNHPKPSKHKVKEDHAVRYFQKILELGMVGNTQEMENLHSNMKCLYTEDAFSKLIDSFPRNVESEQVLQLFEMVEKNSPGKELMPPPVVCNFLTALLDEKINHNKVIQYMCKHNRPDLAFDLFKRMNRRKLFSLGTLTFEELILGLCQAKLVNECIMVLDEMFELNHTPASIHFYSEVVPFATKANEPYKVIKLFQMMKDLGWVPEEIDVHTHSDIASCIYRDTVQAFCHLWKFDDAAYFLLEGYLPYCCDFLLINYCYAGMFEEANEFLEKMIEKGLAEPHSWSVLVKGFWYEGEVEKSFEFFQGMLSWFHRCHHQSQRGKDYIVVSGELASKDDVVLTFENFKMLINGLQEDGVWREDSYLIGCYLWERLKKNGWHAHRM